MSRSLFLLISLISSYDIYSKEYTVKDGDTLYSIALKTQVPLLDIYNSNKLLGLSPNNIKPGDVIYIPIVLDDDYSNYCYFYSHKLEINLNSTVNEILSRCFKYIEDSLDISIFQGEQNINFWNTFNKSNGYTYYVVNKFIEAYIKGVDENEVICPDKLEERGDDYDYSKCTVEKSEEEKKYIDIIIDAANRGNIHAFYVWDKWEVYFSKEIPKTTLWKLVWDDYDLDYLDSISENADKLEEFSVEYSKRWDKFCENLLYEVNLQHTLKIDALGSCIDSYANDNDSRFIEFFQKFTLYSEQNKTDFTTYGDLALHVNSSYNLMNADYPELAFSILKNYMLRICPECMNSQDLIQKFLNHDKDLGQAIYDGLITFDLNFTAMDIQLNNHGPKKIRQIRERSIRQYKEYFYKYDFGDPSYSLDSDFSYASIISDYAIRLMRWELCDEASKWIDQSIIIYQNPNTDIAYGMNDEFIEPLWLAECFISNFAPDSKNWPYIQKNVQKYLNISSNFLINNTETNLTNIDLALLRLLELVIEVNDKTIEDILDNINGINLILNEIDPNATFGNQIQLKSIHSIYTNLYFYLNKKYGKSKLSGILDPIDIQNYITNYFINNKILNLKIDSSESDLKSLKNKLQINTDNIENIKSADNINEESYKNLLELYKANSEIVSEILSTNKNLEEVLVSNLPNIPELQSKLTEGEFAMFYIEGEIRGISLLIGKNDIFKFPVESNILIDSFIKNIKLTLHPDKQYDFDSSKKLYDIFFRPIEMLVPSDATIFFLGDSFNGINPAILVRNYNNSSNISDYERLVTTEWLINRYNLIRHFQISDNDSRNIKYDKKFLGYGNSTTYQQLGLPDLNEVNDEIKDLAVFSNGEIEDILINKRATKDNLIDKLNLSYEKIVISTHAVESFWKGLTSEPALIFNNNDDDFFLTPSEIINLNFTTDMLILSSCSSSIEGFDDLFKSFLLAGANSIVYSNWELDSNYANEFTTTFMRELWFSNEEKHIALRKTALEFLNNFDKKEYSHPSYWGNFSIAYKNL